MYLLKHLRKKEKSRAVPALRRPSAAGEAPVVTISDVARFSHTQLVAGSGWGKTQAIQHMIACDLDRPPGKEVGLMVIDSQGDLVNRLARLQCFAGNDRLLLLDASQVFGKRESVTTALSA